MMASRSAKRTAMATPVVDARAESRLRPPARLNRQSSALPRPDARIVVEPASLIASRQEALANRGPRPAPAIFRHVLLLRNAASQAALRSKRT